jgi:hypothetical protein
MTISLILLEIDAEVAKLQQARVILSGVGTKRKPGRPAVGSTESPATSFNQEECGGVQTKRRKMSTETRKKMANAQRLRWANSRKTEKY